MEDKVFKYRFKFIKVKELRYLSHLDITRIIKRAILRAGLKLKYSSGFNPKPRLSFSNPTPLGIDSLAEYCDMTLKEDVKPSFALESLNMQLPKSSKLLNISRILEKVPSLMADICINYYEIMLFTKPGMQLPDEKRDMIIGLKKDERFKDSIYEMKMENGEAGYGNLLKLYGYAKILKIKANEVFKFNYFIDSFKDMVIKDEVGSIMASKKESYILKGKKLFTPIEVL